MILTCPDCATRYFVDDAKLGDAGRTVRCSKCGTKWKAEPEVALELVHSAEEGAVAKPPEKPAEEPKPEPLPKVFRQKAVEKKSIRKAVVHGIVWAVMLALVGGLLAAAAIFRVDVVRIIPRAAGAYAMVGMPVNPTGLVFEKVSARPALEEGHSALVVSGSVHNVSDHAVEVPPIRIEMLDEHDEVVGEQVTTTEDPHLKPGETRHFVVSLRDPPASAKDVEVAFVLEHKRGGGHGEKAAHGEPQAHHGAAPAVNAHDVGQSGPALRGPAADDGHHEEPAAHAAPSLRGAEEAHHEPAAAAHAPAPPPAAHPPAAAAHH